MKIALTQVNTRVGDFAGNRRRIVAAAEVALGQGAELAVFAELAVVGYPPRDLLFDPAFVDAALAATEELARELPPDLPVVVGTIARSGSSLPGHPGLWNVAALLAGGKVAARVPKRLLPIYDVFLEPRWFLPGPPSPPLEIAGRRVGILVCEDLWDEGYPEHPPADLAAAGAELFVSLSASPYRPGILARRLAVARRPGKPIVCINALGGNDELLFDGAGFALDGQGRLIARLPAFEEGVVTVDLERDPPLGRPKPEIAVEEELWRALVCGIRDFVDKNELPGVVLGLADDTGSAVVACLAAAALGPERVAVVNLSPRDDSAAVRELAAALGVTLAEAPLEPGGLLLGASDKTALALGQGASAGALLPIGDLTRSQVHAFARWIAAHRLPLPAEMLGEPAAAAEERPPEAHELRRLGHGLVLKVSEKAFGSGRMMPVVRFAPTPRVP